MSLETPNRTRASAVLLLSNFNDPGSETVEFASNNGFASVRFIDPESANTGLVLAMDQPVTNQEGSVTVGGDITSDANDSLGYITPNHFEVGTALIDELDNFQCVVLDLFPFDDIFRLTVTVLAMTAVLSPDTSEPVAP